jgi:DNA/RNA-binding domain of Phe-tRNA-synthetase-like protein
MHLLIQKEVSDEYRPIIGVIYASGVDNTGVVDEIDAYFAELPQVTKDAFARYESPGQHPYLKAWRDAYKKFGSDPHQYRCSAEALVRRVLKGDLPPRINTLVDLYNYVSIKYALPIGGEDAVHIQGDLQLAFANGTEPFVRLNGNENEPPDKGEIVYKDNEGAVCRRWNWREADRTKLTAHTTEAIIVFDAIPPVEKETVYKATEELAGLIRMHCGGDTRTDILG